MQSFEQALIIEHSCVISSHTNTIICVTWLMYLYLLVFIFKYKMATHMLK